MLERKVNRELHSWVEERLSAFMDDKLPPLERARLERHLLDCIECKRTLASLQWTVSLLKQAPAPALPRTFMLPVPKQTLRAPIIGLSLLRFGTAMATLLLVSLVGIDLILQYGGVRSAPATFSPRIAVAQPSAAPPTMPAADAANREAMKDGFRAATTAPMSKGLAAPTTAPTASPPMLGLLPATPATSTPPLPVSKPFMPPAPTSIPAATAAPAAGALQSQTSATRPSVRSSVAQGSPTPTTLSEQGRGGGDGKSAQDNVAVTNSTAAPLQPQPQSLAAEPTAKSGATAIETALPPPATPSPAAKLPAATVAPKLEAFAQPTRVPATQPAVAPMTEQGYALPISPIRIAELGFLFLAVFLGVLTLLLRR